MVRVLLGVTALVLCVRAADAEPRHTVAIEALGKGGLWGVDYEYALTHRFAVGAVGSYYMLSGDHYLTLSPYVMAYPARGERIGWFAQLGPQLIRHTTPSPVPEWQGMTTTAFAGELSSGIEYRNRLVVRVYAELSVGEHVIPWLGASVGWTL